MSSTETAGAAPPRLRSTLRRMPRSRARLAALGYLALVVLLAVGHEIAGRPASGDLLLNGIAFPGHILVLVLVLYPLALLSGPDAVPEDAGSALLTPLFHGAGALVNVLAMWGVVAFARHFRDEARRARR